MEEIEEKQQYECEKCGKSLTEDEIAPWGTIDPKTGINIVVVYCEPDYDAMINKIYGF